MSVASEHKADILARMARGEPLTQIAQSLGYADHSGIIHRLDSDPDYQAALKSGIVGKIEKREAELESAETNVTVTRADRLLGHARWWAEKLDRARFGKDETGPSLAVNILGGGDVAVAIQSAHQDSASPRTDVMSNPNRQLAVAAAQRAKHIAYLASLPPESLAELVASTPHRSPVPPPLVDSEGDKSVALGVGTPDGTELNSGTG